MVAPTNVRFPAPLDEGLSEYARLTGARKSTVVVTAVREWLRMQSHPRVTFVTVEGERHAALLAGPQVWTVAESWLQHDAGARSPAVIADAVGLEEADVEAALAYWAEYRDEIDGILARHHEAQDRALEMWEKRRALEAL